MKKWFNKKYLEQVFETDSNYSEWFGYYNYDVISRDGKRMLCNRADFDGRKIEKEDHIDLGWYDIESGKWHYIDTTYSFNWQQGAMLQWLPGQGNENKVIYNSVSNNHFCSIIRDIESGEKKVIDFPTYCVTPDGKYSITLNYERSYWCRAYHYQSVVNNKYDVRVAEDDGIFKVDLETEEVQRIVKIQDVIKCDHSDIFDIAKHWLEHIYINASGNAISFLHRFSTGSGYFTRLFVCDVNGNNLQIIDGWKDYAWSHFGWKGDDEFVIYSIKKDLYKSIDCDINRLNKKKKGFLPVRILKWFVHLPPIYVLRKQFKMQKRFYMHYKKTDGVYEFLDRYEDKVFKMDGHPSFTDDGRYMITDTYHNPIFKKQKLIIFDTLTKKKLVIAQMYANYAENPASCDLHPKLSYNHSYIVIDTAYTKRHSMIVFRIDWKNVKKVLNDNGKPSE